MPRQPERRGKAHLLLIEDDPSVREALSLTLETEGYRVTRAGDGPEGLACLARERPDIIVLAYMMPHWDGLTTIREIRARPHYAGIPIVLMSATLPPEIDPSGEADVFLKKPVRIDQLLEVLELLFGSDQER